MTYFAIFEEDVATIFQMQWNIRIIFDMFLQYSVLCERLFDSSYFAVLGYFEKYVPS